MNRKDSQNFNYQNHSNNFMVHICVHKFCHIGNLYINLAYRRNFTKYKKRKIHHKFIIPDLLSTKTIPVQFVKLEFITDLTNLNTYKNFFYVRTIQ